MKITLVMLSNQNIPSIAYTFCLDLASCILNRKEKKLTKNYVSSMKNDPSMPSFLHTVRGRENLSPFLQAHA